MKRHGNKQSRFLGRNEGEVTHFVSHVVVRSCMREEAHNVQYDTCTSSHTSGLSFCRSPKAAGPYCEASLAGIKAGMSPLPIGR